MHSVEAEIYHQRIDMMHAVNRRKQGWHIDPSARKLSKGCYMAPNFEENYDDQATLLRIATKDDETVACVWNYACHPTGFPISNHISADFPGVARSKIRQICKANDLPVLYLQGFTGDKRPIELGGKLSLAGRIRRLIGGPHFGKFDFDSYSQWAVSLASTLLSSFSSFAVARRTVNVSDIVESDKLVEMADIISFQRICLGEEISIVAISAEPVFGYADMVAKTLKLDKSALLPVGYTDTVFGYLPTQKMIQEGGYESGGFFKAFNLSGSFKDDLETKVLNKISELSLS
jgi:hypothetical protein